MGLRFKTSDLLKVSLLAALTAVGAWIRIPLPFTDVPFTLQVFFVLLAGALLGPTLGALSQVVYILLGLVGLPVFAGGTSGLGVLFGQSGGYLIGFVIGAYLTGLIAERNRDRTPWLVLAMLVGVLFIYLFGALQLSLITRLTVGKVIAVGVLPFIGFDLIKAIVASVIVRRVSQARQT